jgi:sugar/nucleoside kinase (ribokinase family)
MSADVIVAGHICLDIIPSFGARAGAGNPVVPGKLVIIGPPVTATGGTVSNTGLALHRLGVRTMLMGKVGDDLFGRAIIDILRGYGKSLADGMILVPGEQSSYTVVISPPDIDRCFLHCPGANDTFGAEDIDYKRLAGARLFHFGYPPLMRRMYSDGGRALASIFSRVKKQGLTTSLDMAQPDPLSPAGRADWKTILKRVLPHVDVFLPSIEEILFMIDRPRFDKLNAGKISVDSALLSETSERLLGMGCAVIGLKLGENGLYMRSTADRRRLAAMGACAPKDAAAWAGRELLAPCFKVKVVGTTGSGDCTIAGFLAGLLKGLGPEEVITRAVAVGAFNVEAADATSGIRHWREVERRMAEKWARLPVKMALKGWTWDGKREVWKKI